MTVRQLIKLLDTKENCYGGATGKEREISISVNGVFLGYIESAEMEGHGDGLVTDIDLCVHTDREWEDISIRPEEIADIIDDFIKAYVKAGNEDRETRCKSCNTAYKYGCLECFRNRYIAERGE